jgi:hypothetical protein
MKVVYPTKCVSHPQDVKTMEVLNVNRSDVIS